MLTWVIGDALLNKRQMPAKAWALLLSLVILAPLALCFLLDLLPSARRPPVSDAAKRRREALAAIPLAEAEARARAELADSSGWHHRRPARPPVPELVASLGAELQRFFKEFAAVETDAGEWFDRRYLGPADKHPGAIRIGIDKELDAEWAALPGEDRVLYAEVFEDELLRDEYPSIWHVFCRSSEVVSPAAST
jgi:hypothetical protein